MFGGLIRTPGSKTSGGLTGVMLKTEVAISIAREHACHAHQSGSFMQREIIPKSFKETLSSKAEWKVSRNDKSLMKLRKLCHRGFEIVS